jgi:transcriptional regulator with XRE-family HTH domain
MDDSGIDQMDRAIGLAIRLRRKTSGYSQAALGDAIGVSFQQVQKYERGSNRISFSTLVRIADALGCTIADLVAEIKELDLGPAPNGRMGELLAQPEAVAILEALAKIQSRQLRRAVVELARSLSRES